MKQNALDLLCRNRRFDLVFKYLYVKNRELKGLTPFFTDLYAESIRAFNGYSEEKPSDTIPKDGRQEFLARFDTLIDSIRKNGFDPAQAVPVTATGELVDGAHRLAACAALGLDIETRPTAHERYYTYQRFLENGMDRSLADYGALEYVRLNPNAYIVNLQSIIDAGDDPKVEAILNQYGFIFYKKEIALTFNGYVNLKKLNYLYDKNGNRNRWVGAVENGFEGAQRHARESMGKSPLRAYVFICDSLQKVIEAKAKIRALFTFGNNSVHINDSREEAIKLAELYFNANSLAMLNATPFTYENRPFEQTLNRIGQEMEQAGVGRDQICFIGSTSMAAVGIRPCNDYDYIDIAPSPFQSSLEGVDLAKPEHLRHYPYAAHELIVNPTRHFYCQGFKFITLEVLQSMKQKRNCGQKDAEDCHLIDRFMHGELSAPVAIKERFRLIKKQRIHNHRILTILNHFVLEYDKNKWTIGRHFNIHIQ